MFLKLKNKLKIDSNNGIIFFKIRVKDFYLK
jgi:hypothetical protein